MRTVAREPVGADGKDGFALLAVLWVITGLAVLGLGAVLAGRTAVATAVNRADITRALWHAEDCLARARLLIDDVLAGRAVDVYGVPIDWVTVDRFVRQAPLLSPKYCEIDLRPVGMTLDVNTADADALHAVLTTLGVTGERLDSLVDAVLDWRDSDAVPRPNGAEQAWYMERGRHPPRNGPIADARELRRIRGLEDVPGLERTLGVEPGRICLVHAPPEVLASLPGFGWEAVQRTLHLRRQRAADVELTAVVDGLTSRARRRLMERFADAASRSTTQPDGWIVEARGRAGRPPLTAVVELKLVRAGTRAAIVRRRIRLE